MQEPRASSDIVQRLLEIARSHRDSTPEPSEGVENLAEALTALVQAHASRDQLIDCVTSWLTIGTEAHACWFQTVDELEDIHYWSNPGELWRITTPEGELGGIPLVVQNEPIGSLVVWVDDEHEEQVLQRALPRATIWLNSALLTSASGSGDERLERLRDELVTTVSHEVRTPLSVLRGGFELLLDGDLGEVPLRQQELLRRMQGCADRLQSLADNVVHLGKEATESPAAEPIDLGVHVRRWLTRWKQQAPRNPLLPLERAGTFEVEVHDGVVVRLSDLDLERMLLRVADNPLAFAPESLPVQLAVHATDGHGVLSISDQGPGIPAEEVHRLGTPFFRTQEARRRQIQGAGLGLSVVQTLAQRWGGSLSVESVVGRGTKVSVQLPLVDAAR